MDKIYKVKFQCPNCRMWIKLDVPLGKKLIDFLKKNTCENCGVTFIKNVADWKRVSPSVIAEA